MGGGGVIRCGRSQKFKLEGHHILMKGLGSRAVPNRYLGGGLTHFLLSFSLPFVVSIKLIERLSLISLIRKHDPVTSR